MSPQPHVYQIHLAASADAVWTAITDSSWTRRWFHGTAFTAPLAEGTSYLTVLPDGSPAVQGEVLELRPPGPGVPGRLVQTWRVRYDDALAAEPASRVEWTVQEAGAGLTLLRLVHDELADSPGTEAEIEDGWVWLLDNLKALLETGQPLPRAGAATAAS